MDEKNKKGVSPLTPFDVNPTKSEKIEQILEDDFLSDEQLSSFSNAGVVLIENSFIEQYRAFVERLQVNNNTVGAALLEVKQDRDTLMKVARISYVHLEVILKAIQSEEPVNAMHEKLLKPLLRMIGIDVDPKIILRMSSVIKENMGRFSKIQADYQESLLPAYQVLAKHGIISEDLLKIEDGQEE